MARWVGLVAIAGALAGCAQPALWWQPGAVWNMPADPQPLPAGMPPLVQWPRTPVRPEALAGQAWDELRGSFGLLVASPSGRSVAFVEPWGEAEGQALFVAEVGGRVRHVGNFPDPLSQLAWSRDEGKIYAMASPPHVEVVNPDGSRASGRLGGGYLLQVRLDDGATQSIAGLRNQMNDWLADPQGRRLLWANAWNNMGAASPRVVEVALDEGSTRSVPWGGWTLPGGAYRADGQGPALFSGPAGIGGPLRLMDWSEAQGREAWAGTLPPYPQQAIWPEGEAQPSLVAITWKEGREDECFLLKRDAAGTNLRMPFSLPQLPGALNRRRFLSPPSQRRSLYVADRPEAYRVHQDQLGFFTPAELLEKHMEASLNPRSLLIEWGSLRVREVPSAALPLAWLDDRRLLGAVGRGQQQRLVVGEVPD